MSTNMNNSHFYVVYSDVPNDLTICRPFSIADTGQKSVPTAIGSLHRRMEVLASKLLVALRVEDHDKVERIALTMSRANKHAHLAIFFDISDRVENVMAIANEHPEMFEETFRKHTADMVAKFGERGAA